MENTGQLYAYDSDRMRLRPIFERLKRAGVRNAQVLDPGNAEALAELEGKMDRVIVDAPCTGSGVWRRRPDAKWRLSPQMLEARLAEQRAVLDQAARLVKPGGRLAYITCSVLPPENRRPGRRLHRSFPEFGIVPWPELWEQAAFSAAPPQSADGSAETLLMTPRGFGTDGFCVVLSAHEPRASTVGRATPGQKTCDATPLPLEINKRVAEMTRAFDGRMRIGDWRRGPSANAGGDVSSPMNLLLGEA